LLLAVLLLTVLLLAAPADGGDADESPLLPAAYTSVLISHSLLVSFFCVHAAARAGRRTRAQRASSQLPVLTRLNGGGSYKGALGPETASIPTTGRISKWRAIRSTIGGCSAEDEAAHQPEWIRLVREAVAHQRSTPEYYLDEPQQLQPGPGPRPGPGPELELEPKLELESQPEPKPEPEAPSPHLLISSGFPPGITFWGFLLSGFLLSGFSPDEHVGHVGSLRYNTKEPVKESVFERLGHGGAAAGVVHRRRRHKGLGHHGTTPGDREGVWSQKSRPL